MNEVQGAPAWAQGSQTAAANGQKLLRRSQNLIARREIHTGGGLSKPLSRIASALGVSDYKRRSSSIVSVV